MLTFNKVTSKPRLAKAGASTFFQVTAPGSFGRGAASAVDFHITKDALRALVNFAASSDPEIGGLGFSLHDRLGVDVVELDVEGSRRASSVVYANDGRWANERQQTHLQADPMRVLAMAWHTHPGSMGSPSGKSGRAMGDLGMFEAFFDMNEWMQVLYAPIMTLSRSGSKTVVTLNPWVCVRNPDARLGFDVALGHLRVHHDARSFPEGLFNPAWEAAVEAAKQAAAQPLVSAEPDAMAEMQSVGIANTDPDFNFEKEWDKSLQYAYERSEYVKRIEGVVSTNFRNKTILCVGTGGGSYFVEKLARYMPKKLVLIDPDIVSMSNLSRTNFTYEDAKQARKKVDVLRQRVLAINPFVEVEAYSTILAEMPAEQATQLVQGADLIVEGTDNFASKKLVNELARTAKKPAIYIGVHAGAQSGRIVWSYPSISSCYECVAQERYRAAREQADGSSANGLDLDAQHGSVVDIQLIDMVSLRVTLAMLEAGEESVMGRFFEHLQERGNDIMVRTSLDSPYGTQIFSALMSDLPTTPKPFADELAQYFVGIDVVAFPGSAQKSCVCQKPQASVAALYSEAQQADASPAIYM